jgi:hypothetical protein
MTLEAYFLFDDARQVVWLERLERPLQKIGGTIWLPPILVEAVVVLVALFSSEHSSEILQAGFIGVGAYFLIKIFVDGLSKLSSGSNDAQKYTGWSAFMAFIYLQILDASFSFDGVLGAFAITNNIVIIVLGLGVGAIWVRSLTVYMVRHGLLQEYRYLEHGAHYAILSLAIAFFVSIFVDVPDVITGLVGIGIIIASFLSSREAKLRKNFRQHPVR